MAKFAHIMKEDFTFGIIHLEFPRYIKWYDPSGFLEHGFEIIDQAPMMDFAKAVVSMAFKELEIGHSGGKDFPTLEYEKFEF